MLVVLDTLTPAERVSFVLHDTAPRWRWAPMRRLGGPRRSPRRSPAGRAPHNRRSWGVAGLVWAQAGEPRVVFAFSIDDGRIVGIDLIDDPDHIRELDVSVL